MLTQMPPFLAKTDLVTGDSSDTADGGASLLSGIGFAEVLGSFHDGTGIDPRTVFAASFRGTETSRSIYETFGSSDEALKAAFHSVDFRVGIDGADPTLTALPRDSNNGVVDAAIRALGSQAIEKLGANNGALTLAEKPAAPNLEAASRAGAKQQNPLGLSIEPKVSVAVGETLARPAGAERVNTERKTLGERVETAVAKSATGITAEGPPDATPPSRETGDLKQSKVEDNVTDSRVRKPAENSTPGVERKDGRPTPDFGKGASGVEVSTKDARRGDANPSPNDMHQDSQTDALANSRKEKTAQRQAENSLPTPETRPASKAPVSPQGQVQTNRQIAPFATHAHAEFQKGPAHLPAMQIAETSAASAQDRSQPVAEIRLDTKAVSVELRDDGVQKEMVRLDPRRVDPASPLVSQPVGELAAGQNSDSAVLPARRAEASVQHTANTVQILVGGGRQSAEPAQQPSALVSSVGPGEVLQLENSLHSSAMGGGDDTTRQRLPFASIEPTHARPEVVRQVTGQIIDAARTHQSGVLDIRLMPEDLGRVRMVMTPTDAGVSVILTAERPETMDLIRRHVDILAQDLRQQGHQNLSFHFGDSPAREQGSGAGGDARRLVEDLSLPAPEVSVPAAPGRPIVEGRLDLRL